MKKDDFVTSIIGDFRSEAMNNCINSIRKEFKAMDDISISLIQRKCNTGYCAANMAFTKLIKIGEIKTTIEPWIYKYKHVAKCENCGNKTLFERTVELEYSDGSEESNTSNHLIEVEYLKCKKCGAVV